MAYLRRQKNGKLHSGSASGSDWKSRGERGVAPTYPSPPREPTERQVDTATYTQRQSCPSPEREASGSDRGDTERSAEKHGLDTHQQISPRKGKDDQCQ